MGAAPYRAMGVQEDFKLNAEVGAHVYAPSARSALQQSNLEEMKAWTSLSAAGKERDGPGLAELRR